MKTLEQLLSEIENAVSGKYIETFPESKLRKNTAENIEFLKFNLETITKTKSKDVKLSALENIFQIVLDDHPISDSKVVQTYIDLCRREGIDHRLIKSSYHIEKCIDICEDIIMRLDEDNKDEDSISISELNKKYENKWLYFNGDESGCQWLYIKNIHRDNESSVLCVDGILIDFDGQEDIIGVRSIENEDFAEFHYFGGLDDYGYTVCSELDKAIQSKPIDTDLHCHVIEPKDVVNGILNIFHWIFKEGYDTKVPEISKLFGAIKL